MFLPCVLLAYAVLPVVPLHAQTLPDAAASSSAAMRYLQSTLHVRPEVAACVAALGRVIQANPRYDRLVQLDRYVIRAQVRRDDAIFSIEKPLGIDAQVVIKGSARVRRQWTWRPVITRCGLKAGQVVATSIAPRNVPAASPTTSQPRPDSDDEGDGLSTSPSA
ncbi:MAG: BspC domain-containing protein [Janthinobacterium lividum]